MKIIIITLITLITFSTSTFADEFIEHHQQIITEAKERILDNTKRLEDYEDRPYYYGRQGQDIQSHTKANIREYKKVIEESLAKIQEHQKLAKNKF